MNEQCISAASGENEPAEGQVSLNNYVSNLKRLVWVRKLESRLTGEMGERLFKSIGY